MFMKPYVHFHVPKIARIFNIDNWGKMLNLQVRRYLLAQILPSDQLFLPVNRALSDLAPMGGICFPKVLMFGLAQTPHFRMHETFIHAMESFIKNEVAG